MTYCFQLHYDLLFILMSSRISVCQSRSSGKKVFSRGIYPGAKVIRGKDWVWADQDGGCGKRGKVVGIEHWNESSHHSGAMVEWDHGSRNMYRLGYEGKVRIPGVETPPSL